MGGTKLLTEFEYRLSKIVGEVIDSRDVILFIQELPNVIGGGEEDWQVAAANLLRPGLAGGGLQCIGTTSLADYTRWMQANPDIERRFEKILVNEPSRKDTLEILTGLKQKWEKRHQVRITEEALEVAVALSIHFDPECRLPGKVVDVIDKACRQFRGGEATYRMAEDFYFDIRGQVTPDTVMHVISREKGIAVDLLRAHIDGAKDRETHRLESSKKKNGCGLEEVDQNRRRRTVVEEKDIREKDVFISYSSKDRNVADAICASLERNGIRCWVAHRDISPGAQWGAAIVQAIEASRSLLLVFSEESNSSEQVLREIDRAVAKRLAIITFWLEDVPLSKGLEFLLSTHQWFDARTKPLDQHIQRLIPLIKALLR